MKPSDFDNLVDWQHWCALHDTCATSNRKHRPLDDGQKVLLMFLGGCTLLLIATGFGVALEWQPGNQAEIAREYKAMRYDAMDYREGPIVEIPTARTASR